VIPTFADGVERHEQDSADEDQGAEVVGPGRVAAQQHVKLPQVDDERDRVDDRDARDRDQALLVRVEPGCDGRRGLLVGQADPGGDHRLGEEREHEDDASRPGVALPRRGRLRRCVHDRCVPYDTLPAVPRRR